MDHLLSFTLTEKLDKVYYYSSFSSVLSNYVGISTTTNFSSMADVNKIIPALSHITCVMDTVYGSSQLSGLVPSNYGMLEIIKGTDERFCTFILYENLRQKVWMYSSRVINNAETINTGWTSLATESYVDNKMANLEFKTITLSDYPSSMSLSPATTTLPPGFTTDNTFIMAVRLVQEGGYIRVSHDMYNAVLKYPNIVEVYATEQGLSIGLGNHAMSAIIARTL